MFSAIQLAETAKLPPESTLLFFLMKEPLELQLGKWPPSKTLHFPDSLLTRPGHMTKFQPMGSERK